MGCLEKALADENVRRAKITAFSKEAELADSLVEKFKTQFPTIRASISLGPHAMHGVLLFVDVEDFASLLPIRRALRAAGLPAPTVSDYAEMRRRTWVYGPVLLSAFLPFGEGANCQYVQVGEKTEPVYELRCNGAPVDADA